ncbi:LANO_0H06656g1_1 [Lachancea nothofagi CBS 11611]|uniref:LANO_0H06656g1_1 n=1 Tax=Lachancea nothofagi CBS 11611 TaxID=1266666 RepID=A0A1G4KLP4_9SACH|nr:LANO_0H06656g1_1 [Lachancea nothofagi CBS 11611]
MRKNYIVGITSNDQGSHTKYTIVPKDYKRKCLLNLMVFAAVNAFAFYYIEMRLNLVVKKKIAIKVVFGLLALVLIRNPTVETLYVYRRAGFQIATMQGCVLLPRSLNDRWLEQSYFIPQDRVVDLIINEGFVKGFQVIFYLAVILKDATHLRLVFPVC